MNNLGPDHEFSSDTLIAIETDPLVQASIKTRRFHHDSVHALDVNTKQWFGKSINYLGDVLTMALHSPKKNPPEKLLVFAGEAGEEWSSDRLKLAKILIREFAWLEFMRKRDNAALTEQENYQILNWYKHLCLEVLHQSISSNTEALVAMDNYLRKTLGEGQSLRQIRQQQLLRQLEETTNHLNLVLDQEKLALHHRPKSVSLTSVLQRLQYLMESLFRQKRLWMRIQNQGKYKAYCDGIKLECIIFELLMLAYERSPEGCNVEIGFRALPQTITQIGQEERSMIELSIHESIVLKRKQKGLDLLKKDTWELPEQQLKITNKNLLITQKMMNFLGGEIQFYRLKDQSYLTLVLLPASAQEPDKETTPDKTAITA
ncbi:MAG: hypothetical protein HC796_01920 [Synechococcaceae cyanobacterium RL_1_2]|nr:hypothetical protein [Synechococcaceae cyanobacterium RL_1_2]